MAPAVYYFMSCGHKNTSFHQFVSLIPQILIVFQGLARLCSNDNRKLSGFIFIFHICSVNWNILQAQKTRGEIFTATEALIINFSA